MKIQSRVRHLDGYFARASDKTLSDEVRSDLSKLGVVLICGFVERSVEITLLDKLNRRAHPRIMRFVRVHFKRGTNYDCEAIAQLLDRFDDAWGDKFRAFQKQRDDLVQALHSAYALRNAIAHGEVANPGLTAVKALYQSAQEVVSALGVAVS